MMTYRTGAAGSPSTALAMAMHLTQQTLPADKADLASYYLRSMKPPSQGDEALAKFAELVAKGEMTRDEALEALITREVDRAVEDGAASPVTTALGKVVAAGLMGRAEAAERLDQPPAIEPALEILSPALPQAHAVQRRVVSPIEAEAQFRATMEAIGLRPQGALILDGKKHYVTAVSNRSSKANKSGYYIGWADGVPSGFAKNYKSGEEQKWTASGGTVRTVSTEELAADMARLAAAREVAAKARAEMEEHVAAEVARVWAAAKPASIKQPYLVTKALAGDGLRQGSPSLTIRLKNSAGEWYDLPTAGKLLVPMVDASGKLWSLQTIDGEGTKKYLGGARRQGAFALIGDFSGTGPIGIGEGWATVAKVTSITQMPTVAAFDAGGLMAAAVAMRERYPDRPIVLLADNDHDNPRQTPAKANAGLEKAQVAAKAIGAAVAVPSFTEHELTLSDWDDWARKHGEERLSEALAPALSQAVEIVADAEGQAKLQIRDGVRESVLASLDEAVAWATNTRESGGTVARIRPGTNPLLIERLGLPTARPMVASEIANLLNGTRTDGSRVPGKQIQAPTLPLTELLELSADYRPTPEEIQHILAGRTAMGNELVGKSAQAATQRYLTKFGCKSGKPTEVERQHLLRGDMADGTPVSHHDYVRRVDSSKARVGYVDLTFSAPKSFSVAWALEPTEAGRAILDQAFNDAVNATLAHVETELGQARQGKGGNSGYTQGALTWIEFDHYASRPTVAVVKRDAEGRAYTERMTVKDGGLLPADPQRHKHCLIPNVVLAPDGRMVGLELQRLDDRVHEFGAFFQWQLSAHLKRHGVAVELDERTKMARLSAVPEYMCELLSKRTVNGTDAAREYAAGMGLDWDKLSSERQVGLLKQGVQGDHNQARRMGLDESAARQLKRDGVSDWESWEQQARDAGYEHKTVLHRDIPPVEQTPELREELLQRSYEIALTVLEEELERRAGLSGSDMRVAALRGMIATGIEGTEAEVKAITRRMVTHGVQQDGRATTLEYGKAMVKGREVMRVTTKLHVERETALIELTQAASLDRRAALPLASIASAVAHWEAKPLAEGGLRFNDRHGMKQRPLIDQIGAGGRLAVLIGVAGSGKSALLKPLVTAWKEDGRKVFGVALAWRQADAFHGTGVQEYRAKALQAFLKNFEDNGNRLGVTERDMVVIDEVGLVGTRQLLQILELRERIGFGLVMLGDPKQCQSIEAGPVISLLQRALGTEAVPELLSTTRQLTEDEQITTALFREGKAEQALLRKRDNGTLHVVPGDYTAAVQATADLWQSRRDANADKLSYSISVSAPTNHDARMISAAIRVKRREHGEVGKDEVRIDARDQAGATYDLRLAVGDRVRLFDNLRGHFTDGTRGSVGRNGSVLEVRGFRAGGKNTTAAMLLCNAQGRESWVSYDNLRGKDGGRVRLTYGDVLTTNSAQGETVDDHVHAMPGGTKNVNGFAAYTSGSRHRHATHVITSDGAERDEVSRRRPLGDLRPVREWDVLQNIARNLSRQPEKTSALAILEMVAKTQRNVARGLQESLHRAEEREHRGLSRSNLGATLEANESHDQVEELAASIGEAIGRRADITKRMRGMSVSLRAAVERGMEAVSPALLRGLDLAKRLGVERGSGPEL